MNPLPIVLGAMLYWVLGALWYSALFGGVWAAGLAAQGIQVPEPTRARLTGKLVQTFFANVVTAAAVAALCGMAASTSVGSGLLLGVVAGIGVAATSLAVAYTWESKPMKVFAVDASYHVLGTTICAVVVSLWR